MGALRGVKGQNEKFMTLEVSGPQVGKNKLDINFAAERMTNAKLDVKLDMENTLVASLNCGIEGRKMTLASSLDEKLRGHKFSFDASLDLNETKFMSKVTWTSRNGGNKKEMKLDTKIDTNANKVKIDFVSPFAGFEKVSFEGTKESIENGAAIKGSVKGSKDLTVLLQYQYKLSEKKGYPVMELETKFKGTSKAKSVDFVFDTNADRFDNKIKAKAALTGSEFGEYSMEVDGGVDGNVLKPEKEI